MFELSDIDFSTLYCSDELEAVGIENATDLIKPSISALLKDGIQRHITACNLSRAACDELLESLEQEGFKIVIDKDIQPDNNVLPTSFSDTSEDAAEDTEHRRALNYASWVLENIEFDQWDYPEGNAFLQSDNTYPVNLLNAIFGTTQRSHFNSPELLSIIQDEIDEALCSLTSTEEKLLRATYQYGIKSNNITRILGIQETPVLLWSIGMRADIIKSKALRKLRHPSRSKRLKDYLSYISYLANVNGATLEDIKASFLHESCLTWQDELNEEVIIDWDNLKYSSCLERIIDVNALSAKLILYTNYYRWCPWPTGLLMGSALPAADAKDKSMIKKVYFSTNAHWGHYFLIVSQLSSNEDSFALFEFSEGSLKSIPLDVLVLKNLHRKIEYVTTTDQEPDTLRTLYSAEQQYCTILLEKTNDLREKEYYQMFLELISERMIGLANEPKTNILDFPIEELGLTNRPFILLKRANINSIGDLISMTEDELMRVRNLGRKSFEEVICKVQEWGLSLKDG